MVLEGLDAFQGLSGLVLVVPVAFALQHNEALADKKGSEIEAATPLVYDATINTFSGDLVPKARICQSYTLGVGEELYTCHFSFADVPTQVTLTIVGNLQEGIINPHSGLENLFVSSGNTWRAQRKGPAAMPLSTYVTSLYGFDHAQLYHTTCFITARFSDSLDRLEVNTLRCP
ncbi:MAG: hypothetical protein AABX82_01570 [Nanoarchaeota archaeon]